MKHQLAILAGAAAVALSFAMPASAQTYTFASTLVGAAEAPPVITNAGASILVTFDTQASTVNVSEFFFGLSAGGLTANHIHCCTTTPLVGTSGVALGFTGLPLGSTSGTYFNTFTLATADYTSLLDGALTGMAYANIHTAANPGGEIRGFLQLVNVTPVPEPATYALLLGGLAAVGFAARRRQS